MPSSASSTGSGSGGGGLTDVELRASAVPVSIPTPVPVTDNAGSLTVDGTVAISNLPSTQPVSGTFWQATQPISGSIAVSNLPVTQPVSGTFFPATQPVSATTLPLPTGASTETTLALIKAKTDNLDVALSTRTKPADTQTISGSISVTNFPATQPVSATSLPLPSGAATSALQTQPGVDIGDVTINNAVGVSAVNVQDGGNSLTVDGTVAVTQATGTNLHVVVDTAPTTAVTQSGTWTVQPGNTANTTAWLVAGAALTKGSQGGTGFSVQELKDAGRTNINFYATGVASGTTGTETAISLVKSAGTGATSSAATFVITSGKTFRITSITFATRGNATATAQVTTFNVRLNTAGAVTTSSTPVLFSARCATPATALAWDRITVPIADGYEITGNGTIQFGVTANAVFVTNAPTWDVIITGFEY